MKRAIWVLKWQVNVTIALLAITGLQGWGRLSAQANVSDRATSFDPVQRSGAIEPSPPADPLLATIIPALPPLGDAESFLPAIEEPIRLVIRLNQRRVYVYNQEQEVANFPIAVGRSGWETPTGEFTVLQMQRDPIWQHPFTGELVPPGPSNPLGSRWIGFWTDGVNFIGFHGTPNAETVGQAASHGCIRMYDEDVAVLFDMVTVGTPVSVLP